MSQDSAGGNDAAESSSPLSPTVAQPGILPAVCYATVEQDSVETAQFALPPTFAAPAPHSLSVYPPYPHATSIGVAAPPSFGSAYSCTPSVPRGYGGVRPYRHDFARQPSNGTGGARPGIGGGGRNSNSNSSALGGALAGINFEEIDWVSLVNVHMQRVHQSSSFFPEIETLSVGNKFACTLVHETVRLTSDVCSSVKKAKNHVCMLLVCKLSGLPNDPRFESPCTPAETTAYFVKISKKQQDRTHSVQLLQQYPAASSCARRGAHGAPAGLPRRGSGRVHCQPSGTGRVQFAAAAAASTPTVQCSAQWRRGGAPRRGTGALHASSGDVNNNPVTVNGPFRGAPSCRRGGRARRARTA